jgi:site-specific DNA-cytosine methylase
VRTIGTLFSGFGGVDIGAIAAGVTPIWALEYDADIAAVYRQNIDDHVRVGDILDMNPADFETPDILHASPPCPNFSQAKTGAAETAGDIALAQKVADFITELLPPFVTLENVYMYRQSQSWQIIAQALLTHGYAFNYWRVNMADYGVPQTRQRMVVIARRDGIRPQLPPQTHAENPQPALFGGLQRWVSWYEVIADLIPGLPDSEFAPWQLERLPYEPTTFLINGAGNTNFQEAYPGRGCLSSDRPSHTITTVTADGGSLPRAFIMDGGNTSKAIVCRPTDAPYFTVTSGGEKNPIRAFVAAQGSYGSSMPIYDAEQPHGTITANTNQTSIKAQVGGRVVQLSLRCLARLQTFPDHYQLPEDRGAAARGIGNAVPPLFYQRLAENLS